jgi:lysophospholipase L1-like esterase
MTTRSLLWWVALLGGAELTAQGHVWGQPAVFHAAAWVLSVAIALAAWRRSGPARAPLAAAACVPIALSGLAAIGVPAAPPEDPLAAYWRDHAADREQLDRAAEGEILALFGAEVALDAHGFRAGQALAADPGYRIVAVGGSTTFGAPRPEDGPPWPARLEAAIAELGCAVPVSVYNAGRIGRGIAGAVRHFEEEIAPLRPRLVVVYPAPSDLLGLARAVYADIPIAEATGPRVSSLLRAIEVEWRLREPQRRYRAALAGDAPALDTDAIPLAAAYRSLILQARRLGVDVALATASLALAADAPEAEIRRYEAIDAGTRHALLANRAHDRLVRQVGAAFRAIPLDSGAQLAGGGDEVFIDVFHPNATGRERLARNLLAGLRRTLEAQPEPGC